MSNELLRTRIGNTVTVVLPVLTRGDAVSLVGRDITIMLVDPNDTKTPVSFTIGGVSNNIATFVVEGTSQSATGTYRAEVYENYRGTAMAVYDCDIFVLVARTEYENDGNEGVSSETTTLDPINIAWVGRDGYTPYIQDGYWYINGTSTNVKAAGENGDTPYIENGYWYIGGVSTGIKVDYTTEEAQRAAAEQVRVVAEAARVQAEAARTLAENSRLTEESGRSAAEGVRILAERDRQAAETTRQTQEEIRHDNEEARVEAELGRAASEASRAQVEATRVANESARTTAEATRAANEQTRVAEETDRAAAETARIAAETARETAEGGRTSAEATRVSNEQTRVSNESTRQSNESARQSAETARQAAYVAAENARDAAFAEKEATRDAANQAALDCADTLAALGPKIEQTKAVVDLAMEAELPTNYAEQIDTTATTVQSQTMTYEVLQEQHIIHVTKPDSGNYGVAFAIGGIVEGKTYTISLDSDSLYYVSVSTSASGWNQGTYVQLTKETGTNHYTGTFTVPTGKTMKLWLIIPSNKKTQVTIENIEIFEQGASPSVNVTDDLKGISTANMTQEVADKINSIPSLSNDVEGLKADQELVELMVDKHTPTDHVEGIADTATTLNDESITYSVDTDNATIKITKPVTGNLGACFKISGLTATKTYDIHLTGTIFLASITTSSERWNYGTYTTLTKGTGNDYSGTYTVPSGNIYLWIIIASSRTTEVTINNISIIEQGDVPAANAKSTLKNIGVANLSLELADTLNDIPIYIGKDMSTVTQIVNSGMTKAEFIAAYNAALSDYATLNKCHITSFYTIASDATWQQIYELINRNHREEIAVEGKSYRNICDDVNHAFTHKIYRFCDAKLGGYRDFSLKIDYDLSLQEPSVIVSEDGNTMYLYAHTYRLYTHDGVNWSQPESVVLSGSVTYLMHRNVCLIDGVYYLIGPSLNEGGSLYLFTSTDGINFTYQGKIFAANAVLDGTNEISAWGNPSLIKDYGSGTFYLYIEAMTSTTFWRMYLATCTDILQDNGDGTVGDWEVYSGNPILASPFSGIGVDRGNARSSAGNFDFFKLSDNRPVKCNGKYMVQFHASFLRYAYLLRASSEDLVNWDIDGIMLNNRDAPTRGDDGGGNADACFIEFKGRTYLFYTWDINNANVHPYIKYMIDDRPLCELLKLRP